MTLRQKLAISKVVESHGKKAVSKAMLEAGFAPKTAKNPKNLTESKGWKELMDVYMPDNLLLEKHTELLDSKQDQIRLGAVGLGYKVKGKLQPEAVNNFNVGEMSVQFREKE